jgi:hypothetical protein
MVFGASDENALLATRMYKQRFPDSRQPAKKSFENVIECGFYMIGLQCFIQL